MPESPMDVGLINRIRHYVANDINSKIPLEGSDAIYRVKPEEIYVLSFVRVLNNWQATVTAEHDIASFYKLVYDGTNDQVIVTVYLLHATFEAIV